MIMSTVSDTVTEIHRAVPAGEWDNRLGQRRTIVKKRRFMSVIVLCYPFYILSILFPVSFRTMEGAVPFPISLKGRPKC